METARQLAQADASMGRGNRKTRQSPPVRLPEAVYTRIASGAEMEMRSVPKQVEYLLTLGETVVHFLSREDLFNIQSGLARLVVEPVTSPEVDLDDLLDDIDRQRSSGALTRAISGAKVVYQACEQHPGLIERINTETGARDIGTFKSGKFRKSKQPE